MRLLWTALMLLPLTVIAQEVTLLKQKAFPKTVSAGNYSGITWLGASRYAIANDKSPTAGFYLMNIYGKAMGIKITKEATPSIVALIELVDKKSDKSAKALKKVYFRKRPYVQLGETTPVPQWEKDSRKSSSYASHHSNLGWALSMVMAEVAPECQDEVLRIGFNYGYDRVIVGYHWASDVEAGRLLAAALVARMHADADFRQLIKQARAEYLKVL